MVDTTNHGNSTAELKDRSEIADVLNRYADGMRVCDMDRLVSCFTDDPFLDYGDVTLRGVDEVRQYFSRITSPPVLDVGNPKMFDSRRVSTPVVTNVVIVLNGSEAHCESMCLAIHAGHRDGDGKVVIRGTRNIDEFVRTAIGWKIHARRHETLWSFEVSGTLLAPSS